MRGRGLTGVMPLWLTRVSRSTFAMTRASLAQAGLTKSVQGKQGEFGEHPTGQYRAEPAREGVETMHPAPHVIEGEEIVRSARINEGAEGGRNDRSHKLAWAAGFIEGDGSIMISSNHGGRRSQSLSLYLTATQVDPRPLFVLRDMFTGAIQHVSGRNGGRDILRWTVVAKKAEAAIREMLPYFVCKKDQAELALAFRASLRTNRSHNRTLTADEVMRQQGFSNKLKDLHAYVWC